MVRNDGMKLKFSFVGGKIKNSTWREKIHTVSNEERMISFDV
jgi:hypothetical protein